MTSPPTTPAQELVLVLDFGSQYSQLIARRVREANVYCELVPGTTPWARLAERHPSALILSGGPASVYDANSPQVDDAALAAGLPLLGICYGCNLIARDLGGEVAPTDLREYGAAELAIDDPGLLLRGLSGTLPIWMSHGDQVLRLPPGFANHGHTANAPFAAFADAGQRIWGIQFHPEVAHTRDGMTILKNFLFDIAGLQGTWTPRSVVDDAIERVRAQVGRRAGHLRALGRRRLGGGGDAGPPRGRGAAHLRLRRQRPASPRRGGDGAGRAPRQPGHLDPPRAGGRAVPGRAGRGHRARAEAEGDRGRVHRGLRGGGAAAGRHRLPGPGHALPGRHRERPHRTRWRAPSSSRSTTTSAGSPRTSGSSWSSRCATSSRTRSGGWAWSWASRRRWSSGSRSRGRGSPSAASAR